MQSTTRTSPAVYALDIGVYEIGTDAQALSRTTAAWCRVDAGVSSFQELEYRGRPNGGTFVSPRGEYPCGRNLENLADLIRSDLSANRIVVLGFEAPMWLPLEHEHRPRLNLFAPRFPAEIGFAWYLQSGAAATLKSIALGVLLRECLKQRLERFPLATTLQQDATARTLVLFEAFVAGRYKVANARAAQEAPNEWDAFTAALAWGARHAGFSVPSCVNPIVLHSAGGRVGPAMSVWGTIFSEGELLGPTDCEVVAMEPVSVPREAG